MAEFSGKVITILMFGICFNFAVFLSQEIYWSSSGNFYCFACQAGHRVDRHCSIPMTNSTCLPCQYNTYAHTFNSLTYCNRCSTQLCPKNGMLLQNCTSTTNRECQCKEGYHKFPLDSVDPFFECIQHTKCTSTQGEVFPGNATHNTECRECRSRVEFVSLNVPEHPKCKVCSKCSEGMALVTSCSQYADTICEAAINVTFNYSSHVRNTSSPTEPTPNQLSTGEICAIVVVLVVVIVATCTLLIWWFCRHRKHRSVDETFTVMVNGTDNGISSNWRSSEERIESHSQSSNGVTVTGDQEGDLLLDWSPNFIRRTVFCKLIKGLKGWNHFIMQLPGWKSANRASVVVEHAQRENQNSTEDQILACLNKWAQECPRSVTKENILKTLHTLSLNELKEELENLRENS